MKIKVGQWVRLNKENTINKIVVVFDNVAFDEDLNEIENTNINKIANTPQELVQVGDIYELNNERIHFINDKNDLLEFKKAYTYKNPSREGRYNSVTAIYTPNKDKTQYTEQWRKEQ